MYGLVIFDFGSCFLIVEVFASDVSLSGGSRKGGWKTRVLITIGWGHFFGHAVGKSKALFPHQHTCRPPSVVNAVCCWCPPTPAPQHPCFSGLRLNRLQMIWPKLGEAMVATNLLISPFVSFGQAENHRHFLNCRCFSPVCSWAKSDPKNVHWSH